MQSSQGWAAPAGDIGTSPLYVYSTTFAPNNDSPRPSEEAVLGTTSMIIWALTWLLVCPGSGWQQGLSLLNFGDVQSGYEGQALPLHDTIWTDDIHHVCWQKPGGFPKCWRVAYDHG